MIQKANSRPVYLDSIRSTEPYGVCGTVAQQYELLLHHALVDEFFFDRTTRALGK